MTPKKQLANYILRFELGDIAASIGIVITIFTIFEHYDGGMFTLLTIITLIVNSFIMRKYGYLVDTIKKTTIIQWMNIFMATALCVVLIVDEAFLYLLFYSLCSLYFQLFYSIYNALAQQLAYENKQHVSASMEVTGKIIYFACAGVIWLFFKPLGAQIMLVGCSVLFLVAAWVINGLDEPQKKKINNQNGESIKNATFKNHGFSWLFQQPIIWLISLTIICNLMILESNTINAIYFYQVLQETPETMALISAAFSVGSLIGGISSFWFANEKMVIYISFVNASIMSLLLAFIPTFSMFFIAMMVFGLGNSATRVMSRSLIMKNIANHEASSFYTLRSSLVSGIQFVLLSMMTLCVANFSPVIVVWFFPVLLLLFPCFFFTIKHYNKTQIEIL